MFSKGPINIKEKLKGFNSKKGIRNTISNLNRQKSTGWTKNTGLVSIK